MRRNFKPCESNYQRCHWFDKAAIALMRPERDALPPPSRIRVANAVRACPISDMIRGPIILGHIPHFFRRTVTATISLTADFVWFQVRRTALTGGRRHTARTVQDPSRGAVHGERDQIRSVAIRAKTRQISSAASRALDTMANTKHDDLKSTV